MQKTSASSSKAAKTVRKAPKRKTPANVSLNYPLEERRKRITSSCEDVRSFWKDEPSTSAADFLIKSRREG